VSNSTGKPISNAVVSLVRQKMKDTTGTDGKYSFISTAVRKLSSIVPQMNDINLNNGVLQFELSNQTSVKVEIFDLKGKLLTRNINMNAAAGTYRFDISNHCDGSKVLVIRAAIGMSEITFRYMPLNNGKFVLSPVSEGSSSFNRTGLTPLADVDTITVTANGYKTKSVAITSLSMEQNISLDSSGGGSTGSLGCGKTLGSINKSGTYTITTSGKSRTYMIRIPDNYDKNNPYRLIFGMHCMGASAQDIYGNNARSDGAYNFYRLGNLATNAILVAPQGPNSNGTWGGQEDHKFFEDLLDLLKGNLCIDTARVFSVGFSFGAMFTYSLSLNHQDQLRAVVCFAPYDGVIWLPTRVKKPIAFMQTTGMSDNTCGWAGAKGCATKHAEDNGCSDPTTIPTSSGQYLVHDFKNCKPGYPVKVVTFGGGHTAGESWMPQMAWDFLKQF
jgi:poly(3-hydroxybutyrate) depolymerase